MDLVYTLNDEDGASWQPPQQGAPGVWHDWFDHGSSVQPIRGITLGNGILVAKWWSPAEVEIAFDTPPFLVIIAITLKFGSTTTADDTFAVTTPNFTDQGLELDPFLLPSNPDSPDNFNGVWPTYAVAVPPEGGSGHFYNGLAISPIDAAQIVTAGADPDSPAWGPIGNVPFEWGEGATISAQRTYYGAFYGN